LKVKIIQKLYWGRGSLYKPLLMFSMLSLFAFSFLMFWLSSSNNGVHKIGVIKAYARKANVENSILSDVTSIPQQNLTKSSVSSQNYNLINWYKVKPGDTLETIAKKFHTTPNILKWSNNLSTNTVTTGESLNILPISGTTYTVKPSDTLATIAQKFKVPESSLRNWNILNTQATSNTVNVGETLFIPARTVISVQNNNIQRQVAIVNKPQPGVTSPSIASGVINNSATNKQNQISGKVSSVKHVSTPTSYYYNQSDPQWANVNIGYSGYTIGEVGCLITDVAMVAKYYGYNINPVTIAKNPANFVGPLYNWNGLGILNVTPLGSLFGGYVNWSSINNALSNHHPVIVSVGYGYHYVLLLQRLPNGGYIMNDPALGANLVFNNYYSTASVTQAVMFTPN
jgi:LysM repeat protein